MSYEQTEMDLRTELNKAVVEYTTEAVSEAHEAIMRYPHAAVRNRHEAYGIAADNYTKVDASIKSVKGDIGQLLKTLADPNYPAIEAVSSLHNSCTAAAATLIRMAAEMKRTMSDLYTAERSDPESTPLEDYMNGNDGFSEAEAIDE